MCGSTERGTPPSRPSKGHFFSLLHISNLHSHPTLRSQSQIPTPPLLPVTPLNSPTSDGRMDTIVSFKVPVNMFPLTKKLTEIPSNTPDRQVTLPERTSTKLYETLVVGVSVPIVCFLLFMRHSVRADLKSNHLVTKRCPLLPWNSGVAAGVLVGPN